MHLYNPNSSFISQIEGSTKHKYLPERVREEGTYSLVLLRNICGMTEYKNKSQEEIRAEDYDLGRRAIVNNNILPRHLMNVPVAVNSYNQVQFQNMGMQNQNYQAFNSQFTNPNLNMGQNNVGNYFNPSMNQQTKPVNGWETNNFQNSMNSGVATNNNLQNNMGTGLISNNNLQNAMPNNMQNNIPNSSGLFGNNIGVGNTGFQNNNQVGLGNLTGANQPSFVGGLGNNTNTTNSMLNNNASNVGNIGGFSNNTANKLGGFTNNTIPQNTGFFGNNNVPQTSNFLNTNFTGNTFGNTMQNNTGNNQPNTLGNNTLSLTGGNTNSNIPSTNIFGNTISPNNVSGTSFLNRSPLSSVTPSTNFLGSNISGINPQNNILGMNNMQSPTGNTNISGINPQNNILGMNNMQSGINNPNTSGINPQNNLLGINNMPGVSNNQNMLGVNNIPGGTNISGTGFLNNMQGNALGSNTLGSNTLGSNIFGNTLGSNNMGNTLGSNTLGNTFGSNIQNTLPGNTFGNINLQNTNSSFLENKTNALFFDPKLNNTMPGIGNNPFQPQDKTAINTPSFLNNSQPTNLFSNTTPQSPFQSNPSPFGITSQVNNDMQRIGTQNQNLNMFSNNNQPVQNLPFNTTQNPLTTTPSPSIPQQNQFTNMNTFGTINNPQATSNVNSSSIAPSLFNTQQSTNPQNYVNQPSIFQNPVTSSQPFSNTNTCIQPQQTQGNNLFPYLNSSTKPPSSQNLQTPYINNFSSSMNTNTQPNNASLFSPNVKFENTSTFTPTQFPSINPAQSLITNVNDDPYLISGIKFEKSAPKEEVSLRRLLPEYKFTPEPAPVYKLKIESNKSRPKSKVHTVPALEECMSMPSVRNLKVYLDGAVVEYFGDIESTAIQNIENKLVTMKPYIYTTDEKGKGLNKHARVTMYDYWPVLDGKVLKSTHEYPLRGVLDRFCHDLKDQDGYVDYNLETGQYVYETEFFEYE